MGRHRAATAIGAATIAVLVTLVALSARWARMADRESADLRAFAHAVVFDVNDSLATVPGTTEARKQLVETALRHLDRLSADRTTDLSLREELASLGRGVRSQHRRSATRPAGTGREETARIGYCR
jgi:non-specific serine/threonine protein kinase/serine/threonine-protein kinase